MIGADGAAQGVVVLKMRAKTEGKNGGVAEALGDDARMIATSYPDFFPQMAALGADLA